MCERHCTIEFMKHVLPRFLRPLAWSGNELLLWRGGAECWTKGCEGFIYVSKEAKARLRDPLVSGLCSHKPKLHLFMSIMSDTPRRHTI